MVPTSRQPHTRPSFTAICRHLFTPLDRARGEQYWQGGRVHRLGAGIGWFRAEVRGSATWAVAVQWPDASEASAAARRPGDPAASWVARVPPGVIETRRTSSPAPQSPLDRSSGRPGSPARPGDPVTQRAQTAGLTLRANQCTLSCTCPRFGQGDACKHLWAVLLAMDSAGIVAPHGVRVVLAADDSPRGVTDLVDGQAGAKPGGARDPHPSATQAAAPTTPRQHAGEHVRKFLAEAGRRPEATEGRAERPDSRADSRADTRAGTRAETSVKAAATAPPSVSDPLPPVGPSDARTGRSAPLSSWRRTLGELGRALAESTAPAAGERVGEVERQVHGEAESWYAVDLSRLRASGELTIGFLERRTRRDGTPGKLRPFALDADRVRRLSAGEEREALALLAELPAHRWWRPYEVEGAVEHRYETALPATLYQLVLPRLAGTERLIWRPDPRRDEVFEPLAWDDGPPWQLRLRAERRAEDGALTLTGELWRSVGLAAATPAARPDEPGAPAPEAPFTAAPDALFAPATEASFATAPEAPFTTAPEALFTTPPEAPDAPAPGGEKATEAARAQLHEEVRSLAEPRVLIAHGLVFFADRIARLAVNDAFPWIATLRKGEVVIPAEDESDALAELLAMPSLPPVEGDVAGFPRHERETPRPRLTIFRPPTDVQRTPAGLSFDYRGVRILPEDARRALAVGSRILLRDAAAEQKAILQLVTGGAVRVAAVGDRPWTIGSRDLAELVETLLADGWEVEAEGGPLRRASSLQVSVASGIDWLDLAVVADFEGAAPEVSELLAALARRDRFVRLGDGSRGLLPQAWIDRWNALGRLAAGNSAGTLRFLPTQALLLDALLAASDDAGVALRTDAAFDKLRERLHAGVEIVPAEPAPEFVGHLRPYQQVGLGWLRFLAEVGLGGCLADDMGLGKTVQVLAHLVSVAATPPTAGSEPLLAGFPGSLPGGVPGGGPARRGRAVGKGRERPRPSLVVAPRSVVHNWLDEAKRFAPSLAVIEYGGADREAQRARLGDYDLVVTTYGMVRRDAAHLHRQRFAWLVLDEAQAVKSASTQTYKACRLLVAEHRLALSGTPVENHLGELWALLELLNPGLLGRLAAERTGAPGREMSNEELAAVGRAVRPFLLRRTKEQVLGELPEKTEQTLHCVLEPPQRKLYDQLKRHYQTALAERIKTVGLARSKIQVLEALLRLRQAACHPALIDPARADEPSAKLETLVEQLVALAEEGHKALVFSQFTQLLALVKPLLAKAGLGYEYLDGRTLDRRARVERFFADKDCPVFLISLKAGGLGLNLTAASYVFLLDPWWNPAVEAQAIDRAHRIGQRQPVFAYRLIAEDTVEQHILELQQRKRRVADAILAADASALERLTAEDLDLLLS